MSQARATAVGLWVAPQQVGFPCQMLLLELETRLLQYHLRVGLREKVKGQLLGAALSQETRRSCARQNRVLTTFLFVHSESQCLLLRGQQKEVKGQPRDLNVRQTRAEQWSLLLAWPHSFSKSLGPRTTGMSRSSTVCSCPQVATLAVQNCAVNVFLVCAHSCLAVFFVRDYKKKSKLRLAKRPELGIMVKICPTATLVVVPGKQELWSFPAWPHELSQCLFRSWSTEMSKLSLTSRLRIATMIVDRANLCCASLPCFTTQIFQCLPCLWTTKKLKLSLSMWSCPQTGAPVVMPKKCVVCLVGHTDVSLSSLPVDTMEL